MPSTVTLNGIEFTRYVQSSFKIKTGERVLWVDPHRIGADLVGGDKADLLLITHPHGDHLDENAIRAVVRDDTVIVCSPAVAQQLRGKVKQRLVQLWEMQSTEQKQVPIRAVPGYNQFHPRDQQFNVGFILGLGGRQVYHAGDTSKVPEMDRYGQIDICLYPIGGHYTSDEADAAEAVKVLKPRVVIPMHYQYATGGDPIKFQGLIGSLAEVHVLDPVLTVKLGS